MLQLKEGMNRGRKDEGWIRGGVEKTSLCGFMVSTGNESLNAPGKMKRLYFILFIVSSDHNSI